jgi:ribosomal protein S12 methylthiotransferase
LARIQQWRKVCPDITLRSTFIVGFPGETDAEFEELLAFLQEAQLDRVGCFAYSPVEGATANQLPDHVPEAVKEERRARFMQLQEEISRQRLATKVGQKMTVMIDELTEEGMVARSSADAPEIDGLVYVESTTHGQPGDFIEVEITDADAHDLFAVRIDE